LTSYWNIGLHREIGKDDFRLLADQIFGSVDELEKQYVDYILALEMPSAGKVVGDYFVSDTFQFDFKAPVDEWQFFEDSEDKKLLVGLLYPETSAEIRIYYENNIENAEGDKLFERYLTQAERRYKDVAHEKVKIANLDGFRLSYLDEKGEGEISIDDLLETVRMAAPDAKIDVDGLKKPGRGPRRVVRFLLIQVDGVVTLEGASRPDEAARFADTFDRLNELFTFTLSRRW
jgi:hypothetical protein